MSEKNTNGLSPAPWKVREVFDDDANCVVSRGIEDADGKGVNKGVEFEMFGEDDARLMAAAPDMLKVLLALEWSEVMLGSGDSVVGSCPMCDWGDPNNPETPEHFRGHQPGCPLRAAIARATGSVA